MRAVIQRVTSARVSIAGRVVAEIGHGFVALVGIAREDGADDVRYVVTKICQMRVFDGEGGRPNDRSLVDVGGSVLLVSQFTLYGDVRTVQIELVNDGPVTILLDSTRAF